MPDTLRNFFRTPGGKLLLIGLLTFALLLPLSWVIDLIRERASNANSVRSEVGTQWGPRQSLIGPVLVVPYVVKIESSENGKRVQKEVERLAVFTPDVLDVTGQADIRKLHRSIYDVPVYDARLKFQGRFGPVRIADVESGKVSTVRWNDASIVLSLWSVAGLKSVGALKIDDTTNIAFSPGAGIGRPACPSCDGGIHARLGDAAQFRYGPDKGLKFDVDLAFNGSTDLKLAPVARETRVSLTSDWPSPSFQGAFLPSERAIGVRGFNAAWKVLQLARGGPGSWRVSEGGQGELVERFQPFLFGVNFVDPVDFYTLLDRATKYGIMFVVTSFMTVFLLEVISKRDVHGVQYLLTGIALVFFYVLLLSLSEHMGFDAAYAMGSSVMALLIASYVGAAMRSVVRGVVMAVILAATLGLLYFILCLENYALLVGSLIGVVALAVMMFVTLRVNWSGPSSPQSWPQPLTPLSPLPPEVMK